MDHSLVQTISQAGFTEKEALVLMAAFEVGDGSAALIAKRAGLNRSTAYLILVDLAARGFVTELPGHSVRRFASVDPSKLLQIARDRTETLRFMLPLLRAAYNRGTKKPQIEFFEGKAAILSVFETFGQAREACYVSTFRSLRAEFGDTVDRWLESARVGKTKTVTRQLAADEPEGREFAAQVRASGPWSVRFLPKGSKLAMDLAIVDETVAIVSFDPLYAVVIHSEALADSLRVLFDLAWAMSGATKAAGKGKRK